MALRPVAQADGVGRQCPGAPRVLGAPPHPPARAVEKRSSVSRNLWETLRYRWEKEPVEMAEMDLKIFCELDREYSRQSYAVIRQ